jgi:hypothetical protein
VRCATWLIAWDENNLGTLQRYESAITLRLFRGLSGHAVDCLSSAARTSGPSGPAIAELPNEANKLIVFSIVDLSNDDGGGTPPRERR